MGMDSMRAQALQGARQDFYGQMSSGGQGDADLYDNYSRYNNPPRPKTGYKMQQRPHDNTHYLDDPNDYDWFEWFVLILIACVFYLMFFSENMAMHGIFIFFYGIGKARKHGIFRVALIALRHLKRNFYTGPFGKFFF